MHRITSTKPTLKNIVSCAALAALFSFAASCSNENKTDTPVSAASTTPDAEVAPGAKPPQEKKKTKAKMWQGDAKGYVASGTPQTDVVAYLVNVGTVDAHYTAFRELANLRDQHTLDGATIASVISTDMLDIYASTEERAIAETSVSEPLKPSIDALTAPTSLDELDADRCKTISALSESSNRFKFWIEGAIEGV